MTIHIENLVIDLQILQSQHEAEINNLIEDISKLETQLDTAIESEQDWKTKYSTLYFTVSKRCPEILL